ncbi:unnamed protein product, partial [Nesidiocoris tenuis]
IFFHPWFSSSKMKNFDAMDPFASSTTLPSRSRKSLSYQLLVKLALGSTSNDNPSGRCNGCAPLHKNRGTRDSFSCNSDRSPSAAGHSWDNFGHRPKNQRVILIDKALRQNNDSPNHPKKSQRALPPWSRESGLWAILSPAELFWNTANLESVQKVGNKHYSCSIIPRFDKKPSSFIKECSHYVTRY